jgi:predicted NBD/HSP70 family sugar kinase
VTDAAEVFAGVALASGAMTVAVHDGVEARPLLLQEHPVPPADERQVVAQLAQTLCEVGDRFRTVRGVGLSIGGHISQDGREVLFAPGLVQAGWDWTHVPIAQLVESATGLPAVTENDVNCMCAYEQRFGAAAGIDDFLVVYLAPDVQGLGCGIVAQGQLVRGSSGGAGEFGHIVIQPDGPLCRCGNRGCLEAMLAVENFDRDMNWGGAQRSAGFAEAAALLADPMSDRATRVFRRSGQYLGQGLATALNILNPRMIVVGGPAELVGTGTAGGGTSSELFMTGVRDAMADNTFSSMAGDCEIVVDRLDLEMAASGAAILLQRGLADGRVAEKVA